MSQIAPLLADGNPAVVIFFVTVFILVWVFRVVTSSLARIKEQQRQRTGQLPPEVANAAPGNLPANAARNATPNRGRPAAQRKAKGAVPPRITPPPLPAAVRASQGPDVAAAYASAPPQRVATVDTSGASTLVRSLKPEHLRTQFIMTEIFQPPLAIRGEKN
jgi:hypothetical protein